MPSPMTVKECEALFERLAGALEDEGWPRPYTSCLLPCMPEWSICWRRGESGSALILSAYGQDRLCDRFSIMMQILIQERFILIDLSSKLELWPGRHDFSTLLDVLRHFKSVVCR